MGEKAGKNSNSIDSLILGILSILTPFIGLVLGIIGIVFSRKASKQIIKSNEGGKRLATSGLICSIAGIIIQFLVILGYFTYLFMTSNSTVIID